MCECKICLHVSPRRSARSVGWIALEQSGVFLDRVLDGAPGLGQIVRYHNRMNLNAGIEREKPRLGDGWDLRRILHLEKNERRSLTVAVRKIDGLRLQICQDRLNGSAELTGLRGRVAGLNGDVDL
jgi:hypothetical protein